MNLAFSALLGVFLLLPGIIFVAVWKRRLVHPGAEIPPPQHILSIELAFAIPAAMILHLLWFFLVYVVSMFGLAPKESIDLPVLAMLLLGKYGPNDDSFAAAVDGLTGRPLCIAFYFIGLFAFSWWFSSIMQPEGDIFDAWRTRLALDPLPSDWLAFFKRHESDFVFVTIVTELDKTAYLYIGQLHRPYFDPKSRHLDRISLVECYRRKFEQEEDDFKRIEGDLLVIPYAQIKNLLVTYFQATEHPADAPDGAA